MPYTLKGFTVILEDGVTDVEYQIIKDTIAAIKGVKEINDLSTLRDRMRKLIDETLK